MIHFESDYLEGCHPRLLQALCESNEMQTVGYGTDEICEEARSIVQNLCGGTKVSVHFLVGGTQVNKTVIAAALRPHQGVLAADCGHIATHESGAIEATGHKVLTLPSEDGKITGQQIADYCRAHYEDPTAEHTVQPGMVYISHPTELGTVYTKEELTAIRKACDEYGLTLFLDGARLVYGLAASDVTLADLAALCDVFYLGGTKAGTLFGEAVVISQEALKRDFRYQIKQHGGMLAKGRLLGVQFEALLEDGLFQEIGQKAVAQAMRLQKAFLDKGYPMLIPSNTNQQFPILPNEVLDKLNEKYSSCLQRKIDADHTCVRFCTGWSTRDEDLDALIADIATC